ncbi:MAG: aminotransferase class I/II-fold pyridoxal phosphate-dependent enzyme, partial [Clostridia bacterium]|nr:aminotransferase class I/II-fold pyridoxal phosphate-dependent enzyme [Clostridia bacterium]
MNYSKLSKEELQQIYDIQKAEYNALVAQGNKVDIARGKPCNEQLDIAMPMLSAEGLENMPKSYRNYGMLDGIPEMKKLFADMLGVDPSEVIVGGSSSLNLMYDTIQRALQFGICGAKPWNSQPVKFLCPVPGYDRHFAICEHFGIEMINVPMKEDGPNMDLVEQLVANDEGIKAIWCVPKYSNPTGVTYSDEVVTRLATMKTKAQDFRIFWDNAYVVHDLTDTPDELANIMQICAETGNPDRVYQFASTSKVTLAGSGVGCIATSANNVKDILSHLTIQTISYNKVWQYIHYLFLKDMDNVKAIMAKQREIIKPKFDTLIRAFEDSFGSDSGIAEWTNPNGGYFITLDVLDG